MPAMGVAFKEYRCVGCAKLLFKGLLVEGEIELKCKQCHAVNQIHQSAFNELLCLIPTCPHRISFDGPNRPSA